MKTFTTLLFTAGLAATTDSQLSNPWGISVFPGQDFWIADNNSGVSTLYDQNGNKDTGLVVTIPGATSNPNGNCSLDNKMPRKVIKDLGLC